MFATNQDVDAFHEEVADLKTFSHSLIFQDVKISTFKLVQRKIRKLFAVAQINEFE